MPHELTPIVMSVFETMLGLKTAPAEADPPPSSGLFSAMVEMNGSGNGAIVLQCRPEQARAFACRWLDIGPPEPAAGDVRDALGELANMIAGNYKSTLLLGAQLSMPAVTEGVPASLRGDTSGFTTESGPFWVTLIG